MMTLLKKVVAEKFPEFWPQAIGGVIFLRYFCAAIVVPESFALLPRKHLFDDIMMTFYRNTSRR
jgi:hypothetical protein